MRLTLAALAVVLTLAVGCAAPVTIVTPVGIASYTSDQIAVRVNEVMNAAIAANAATPPALSTPATTVLVQFAVAADQTLAAVPSGWLATVQTAWAAAKAKLGTIANPLIVSLMAALDAVLGVVA